MKKEALRVSTTIPAAPTTLYLAWLSPEQHSAMTGGTAKIDASVGGKFTAWNGYITGKLVTLDLGRRIVMSWRTTDFPRELPDSRVEVHFEALGGSTRLTVLHMDIPEGQGEQYRAMWNEKYFGPMRNFFSKYLPDPRKPPPPRPPPPPFDDEEEEEEEEEAAPRKLGKKLKPAPPSKKLLGKPAPPSKAALPSKPVSSKVPPSSKAPPSSKTPPSSKAPKSKAGAPSKGKPAAKPKAAAKKTAPPAKKPAPKKTALKKPAPKKPAPKKAAPKKPAKPAKKKR